MLANAARICEAKYGSLWLVEADGFRPVAHHGLQALETGYPVDRVLRPDPDLPLARLARSKQVVHVLDARTEPGYIRGYPPFLPLIDVGGARTLLLVPMLKEDVLVGAISIYRQRKEQDNSDSYEPTLTAATKNLGDKVEIRIRDNGPGIPPEVREKMFNPFFTTKPAGEGTGLGLSITHDIIVKQHSGSVEVDTQPGEFTEIKVILPRKASFTA
jgi:hypothetical protein